MKSIEKSIQTLNNLKLAKKRKRLDGYGFDLTSGLSEDRWQREARLPALSENPTALVINTRIRRRESTRLKKSWVSWKKERI